MGHVQIRNGWGFSGSLYVGGHTQDFKPQAQAMVDEHGQPLPSMVTVSADLDLSGIAATTVVYCSLEVSFQTDIGVVVRCIDVAAGNSISGVAHKVLARLFDSSPVGTNEKYNVQVNMSRQPRPTGLAPIRTKFFGSLAASATQVVQVPPGATGVIVYGSQFSGFQVTQYANQTTGLLLPTPLQSTDVINVAQNLVKGARFISVTNSSAGPQNCTVAFVIDG